MSRRVAVLVCIGSVLGAVCCYDFGWAQAQVKKTPQEILDKLTEEIDIFSGLMRLARNAEERAGQEELVALSLARRGEFYLLSLETPTEALSDLSKAEEIYARHVGGAGREKSKSENRYRWAKAIFFQGMALRELGKREATLDNFTKAISEYQTVLVDKKMGYAEPMLAYAYQERGKVLAQQAVTTEQAVADFDKAIAILEKCSKEKGYENTYNKILGELRTRRSKAEKQE